MSAIFVSWRGKENWPFEISVLSGLFFTCSQLWSHVLGPPIFSFPVDSLPQLLVNCGEIFFISFHNRPLPANPCLWHVHKSLDIAEVLHWLLLLCLLHWLHVKKTFVSVDCIMSGTSVFTLIPFYFRAERGFYQSTRTRNQNKVEESSRKMMSVSKRLSVLSVTRALSNLPTYTG